MSGCRYESGKHQKSGADPTQYPDRAGLVEEKREPPTEVGIGQRVEPTEHHEHQPIDRDLPPIGSISGNKLWNEGEEEDDPLWIKSSDNKGLSKDLRQPPRIHTCLLYTSDAADE